MSRPSHPTGPPGSHACVGCGCPTYRNRDDGLCPRCAWHAESLIEQIELASLDRDLTLLAQFEAFCQARDAARDLAEARDVAISNMRAAIRRSNQDIPSSPDSVPRLPWPDRQPSAYSIRLPRGA